MRLPPAALKCVLSCLAALAIAACRPAADDDVNDSGNAAIPPIPLPVAEPPLDREDLLLAVFRVSSAVAVGGDDRAPQAKLDAKPFEIRIRFGCAASGRPADEEAPFAVRFNQQNRTLRVRATPDLSLDDPIIAALAGEAIEAVEGFWMHRPWLLADGCPVSPAPAQPGDPEPREAAASDGPADDPPPPAGRRVGLAQFFTEADARTGRRDSRAYEATRVLPSGELPSRQGYNLVLIGRLRQMPDGRVISCRVAGADTPPECVVSAEFHQVRIENPVTRRPLANWGS